MKYFQLTLSLTSLFLFTQCKSEKENSLSASDAKILAAVHKAKAEMKMTDEQVEQSIESVVKVYHQINQSVDQGLMDLEDLHKFQNRMEEMIKLTDESNIDTSRSYLEILKQIDKDEIDKVKLYLRFMISMGYKTHLKKEDDAYLKFAKEVEEYAETDEVFKKQIQSK